jgi:hypothetical protein
VFSQINDGCGFPALLVHHETDSAHANNLLKMNSRCNLDWRCGGVFHDPKDGKVKLDGENVLAFPKLPKIQRVTLKVLRWEERDKVLMIKDAETVA